MSSKIYTKTGDKGLTSLLGGTRLPKHHVRIEAYGNVDELNSYVGLLRDCLEDEKTKNLLIDIQDRLFTIGAGLAADPVKNKMELPKIDEEDVLKLETAIDEMDKVVPPMKSFVLPGGHLHVSYCHITRCVCRRAERSVIHLTQTEKINELYIQYLNRLSDYFFMLSRWIAFSNKITELPWKPKK
ncbi:MAG: cob(I)yrinic acid a,c-diamide adenosyltransferase [Sphingobacteriaceae bacterium]|nr:cob(I)yrinic acid a,c-diamide adenosyltransferase [Sphingobacteriaceae bacterium]